MLRFLQSRVAVCCVNSFRNRKVFERAVASFAGRKVQRAKLTFSICNFSELHKPISIKCWKCDAAASQGQLFCNKCHVIQKPSRNLNYYELFGMDNSYDVEDLQLSRKFRELQKVLHPDKFSLRPMDEQSIAEEYSSLINRAYSTLRNPWTRGVYLLKISGIDFDESTTVDDPELLLQVMERNEQVVESQTAEELDSIDKSNKMDIEAVSEKVGRLFKDGKLDEAKQQLIKLKYYTNIDAKISEKKLQYQ